jgi:hypothetical protein
MRPDLGASPYPRSANNNQSIFAIAMPIEFRRNIMKRTSLFFLVALAGFVFGSARLAVAVQDTFTATGNATVQPAGPRTGANGTNFFNLEGSNNGVNSSYGVLDIPLSNLNFGGTITSINSVTLNLTENNSAFTAPGHFSVYLTDNTTTTIANNGTSPAEIHSRKQRYGWNRYRRAGCLPTRTRYIPFVPNNSTPLGTFNFLSSGATGSGQVDSVPLTFTGAAATDLVNRLNSNSILRLVLTPDDLGTAATFTGATNAAASQRPMITIDVNVAGLPYWDTNGSAAGLGGTGTWDTITPNFNDSTGTGTPFAYIPSKLAIFAGTAGTVTIAAGGITENGGLQFTTTGYVIGGDTLTVGTNNQITVVGSAVTTTINSVIAGTNGLNKLGTGTLVLGSGNNPSLSGTVTVSGGTLQIASQAGTQDSTLGAATNGVTLSGGTLKVTGVSGNFDLAASRTVSGTVAGVDVGTGNTFTINGDTNMTGPIILPVAETVVLAGGQKVLGGVTFSNTTGGGILKGGAGGASVMAMNGTITANNTSGTSTIQGSVDFGGTARSIGTTTGGTL